MGTLGRAGFLNEKRQRPEALITSITVGMCFSTHKAAPGVSDGSRPSRSFTIISWAPTSTPAAAASLFSSTSKIIICSSFCAHVKP